MTTLLGNPKFKEFIDAFNEISKASETLSLNEGRKLSTEFFLSKDTVYEPVHQIENMEIQGRDQHKIPLRIYTPSDSKELPALVYFHRGGFVFGNINEADPVCRKLANHLNCQVVSVDYRLAPENPFPKPLDDCYDAAEWASKNIGKKIIVCGESAGGQLAAAVALIARDNKQSFISAQVLICPVISSTINEAPYNSCKDQYFLTKDAMTFFWDMYLQSKDNYSNPYASPDLASDLTGLPPAVIITAEHDPLHVEAEDYARRLKAAEIPVVSKCFPEVIHGFIDLPIYEEKEKIAWIQEINTLLKKILP